MDVTILGGVSEVGASCLHVQIGEKALLVDSGIRLSEDDLLPALEAILVTHAHADHIGALPIMHALYPDVPVYATSPTADLIWVMMKDACY